jgi:hypothetical protein
MAGDPNKAYGMEDMPGYPGPRGPEKGIQVDREYVFDLSVSGSIMADNEDDARRRILYEFNRTPGWDVDITFLELEDEWEDDHGVELESEFPIYYDAQGREHGEY